MSETQKRDKDRRELSELWQAIEPAKNEEIARRALDLAEHYLIKAENQARQIQNLERRNQPTRGKWVWLPDREDEHIHHLCCSLCHCGAFDETNYCPHCGADMRGGEDEQTN